MDINRRMRLGFERLEDRTVLSLTIGLVDMGNPWGGPGGPNGGGGGEDPAPAPTTYIDLEAVALHELGHSLGLEHVKGRACSPTNPEPPVMCGTYSGRTELTATDIDNIAALYADTSTEFTYSFVDDAGISIPGEGAGVESEKFTASNNFPGDWQTRIELAISSWNSAIDHALLKPASGTSDGAVRMFTHYIDGPLNVLAHAYLPETFSDTSEYVALNQDIHFDSAEGWNLISAASTLNQSSTTTGQGRSLVYSYPSAQSSVAALDISNLSRSGETGTLDQVVGPDDGQYASVRNHPEMADSWTPTYTESATTTLITLIAGATDEADTSTQPAKEIVDDAFATLNSEWLRISDIL